MYGIDGRAELKEEVLDHLEGYRGSAPVPGVAGPASAELTERAVETGDVTAATDSHQQDPGPEGTELAPRG